MLPANDEKAEVGLRPVSLRPPFSAVMARRLSTIIKPLCQPRCKHRPFTVAAGFVAGSSADALVFPDNGALSANAFSGAVVLLGLNQALIAADFV